jgi:arylsulfatase A-like enzyme
MIRTKTYKYWIIKNRENLYDLTTDPTEQHNQAQKPKAQELLHTARYDLLKALINCEDPLPTPNHL